ncbi:MAG: hypothetical protein K0V04_43995 [Deltaproteobacteria bacterium]|nr:hypothetical protein [Deltaproteobacteria bacterium]
MAYSFNPARGLLHPAWLTSLAVLALNDHVLKGADILPSAVTGKLSDVAGLLVAPLLLAALLGVRRWRPWVACHLAIGLVFAAIQLSAEAAAGWSTAMSWIGFPWVITRDVTDLLTLPVLGLSLWGYLPAMQRSTAANARRAGECGAAAVGLACSVATSSPDPEPEPEPDCCAGSTGVDDSDGDWEEPLPPIRADVFLHNAAARDIVVRIRELRTDVALDCDAVAESPGSLLRSSLFAPASSWTLPANSNVAVVDHAPGAAACYAAWVEADAIEPTVLMWFDGDPASTQVDAHGGQHLPGAILVEAVGTDGLALNGRADLIHVHDPIDPETEGQCATQPDADRIGWSTPVPWGAARITDVTVGLDGCLGIDLAQSETQSQSWYLCVPTSSFPFEAGDDIELRLGQPVDGQPGVADVIEMVALDELGQAQALPMLTVSAGGALPSVPGVELAALPLYSCDVLSEPACGTVERPMTVVASGEDLDAAELLTGEAPTRRTGFGRTVEMTLLHAQERFVIDPACALGPASRGADLEFVVAQWPSLN